MVDEVLAVGAGEVVGIAVAAVGEVVVDELLIAVQEVDEGIEVAVVDVEIVAAEV